MMSHRNVACQHNVAEVACYRRERTLMGCANPRVGGGCWGGCTTISGPRVNENEVDGGSFCHGPLSTCCCVIPVRFLQNDESFLFLSG